jgi:hypothetical protein
MSDSFSGRLKSCKMHWYVVSTKPNHEKQAEQNIRHITYRDGVFLATLAGGKDCSANLYYAWRHASSSSLNLQTV